MNIQKDLDLNKMNIMFLDIDGVLNDTDYYKKIYNEIHDKYNRFESQFRHIDIDKLKILKEITKETNSYIVITSSWKSLSIYQEIKNYLISLGIPIIGETKDSNSNRGEGIKNYIKENNVEKYVILDDDIFEDYDEELLSNLVKTSFMKGGLNEEHKILIIKKFNN